MSWFSDMERSLVRIGEIGPLTDREREIARMFVLSGTEESARWLADEIGDDRATEVLRDLFPDHFEEEG